MINRSSFNYRWFSKKEKGGETAYRLRMSGFFSWCKKEDRATC
ncbi:MAG: hypothetical protein R6V76_00475 [Desulfobacterales bacterium]